MVLYGPLTNDDPMLAQQCWICKKQFAIDDVITMVPVIKPSELDFEMEIINGEHELEERPVHPDCINRLLRWIAIN